jgi:hypothetical protein
MRSHGYRADFKQGSFIIIIIIIIASMPGLSTAAHITCSIVADTKVIISRHNLILSSEVCGFIHLRAEATTDIAMGCASGRICSSIRWDIQFRAGQLA